MDKHAPLRSQTVKEDHTPWLDDELKALMSERDTVKITAHKSDCP